MPKSPEEILIEAKKLIGSETPISHGRYPVECDAIRRFCHMTGDSNPLYLDPEYAKKAGYKDQVCPPLLVGYFGGQGLWPEPEEPEPTLPPIPAEGLRFINLTTELEFYKPVVVGDKISKKQRFADVYIKSIRLDPKAFWTRAETLYYNQDGELVVKAANLLVSHRTPEQILEAGEQPGTTGPPSG